jgi:uncharacterized membrane protein
MRKIHWLIIFIITLFPVIGIMFYPYMPEQMGTHWQFGKTPDGYMGKFNGTFLTALICVISPTILLIINIGVSTRTAKTSKNILLFFLDYFTIVLSLSLLAVYTAVLVWNYGIDFSIPIFMGVIVGLLVISELTLIVFIMIKTMKPQMAISPISTNNCIPSDGKYKDSLIEISQDNIIFKNYYFPMGSKSINLSQVEYVEAKPPTLGNGKWRLHGTGDLFFRIWFPADYGRPSRDKIFVMKVKDKWIRIGFTVENSQIVSELFKSKGLLR